MTIQSPDAAVVTNPWEQLQKYQSANPPRSSTSEEPSSCVEKKKKGATKSLVLRSPITINNVCTEEKLHDNLHTKVPVNRSCCSTFCSAGIKGFRLPSPTKPQFGLSNEKVSEIHDFFEDYFTFIDKADSDDHWRRVADVLSSNGHYELTTDELTFGARMAWRNAPWSLDRLDWKQLQVFDCRRVTTTQGMFQALCRHLTFATNGGKIRPAITVFGERVSGCPDFRIWNRKLIAYAGYEQADGTVIGDPENVVFTQLCQRLGWKGLGRSFDVLPLVLNVSGGDPELFEIPEDLVLQVKISHPDYPWFSELGLQWYAMSSVADKELRIGGVVFPAAPLSGWQTNAEIGARAFSDPHRYNKLQTVAKRMGLDVSALTSLWKDEALVEINVAVLHSFRAQKVRMLDHYTAAALFVRFLKKEYQVRGGCPADWTQIVSPIGGSLNMTYHQEMLNYTVYPAFEQQENAWKCHEWVDKEQEVRVKGKRRNLRFATVAKAIASFAGLGSRMLKRRVRATVVYASETGRSEMYARRLAGKFDSAFQTKVICMKDYDFKRLADEQLLLVVASTFGSGEPPENGKKFSQRLETLVDSQNNNNETEDGSNPLSEVFDMACNFSKIRSAVFALGSSAYPDFCQFGQFCHETLESLGTKGLLPLATADELKGQDGAFRKWSTNIFQTACQEFKLKVINTERENEERWPAKQFRLQRRNSVLDSDLDLLYAKVHGRSLFTCRLTKRSQLQSLNSNRQTTLVQLAPVDGSILEYEPGDHLGVMPVNRIDQVMALLSHLPASTPHWNDTFQVERSLVDNVSDWSPISRVPPTNLITAFSRFLDITTPPTQDLLRQLAQFAQAEDQTKLETLAKDEEAYEEWKTFRWPTLLEVLEEFPTLKPEVTLLLTQLPLLQPRYYSISSSLVATPGEVQATVGVVQFKTQGGEGPVHYGVCSNYLNNVAEDEDMFCFIKKASSFHLPADKKVPILMIGPGTGIAPFRGFWQQRAFEMRASSKTGGLETRDEFGKMILYFGCRHPKMDHLYKMETERLVNDGVLTSTRTAYSRLEGTPKTYVQHLLTEDLDGIYQMLVEEKGHVYVCGEATMAIEVRKTLLQGIQNRTNLPEDKIRQVLLAIKNEGRYHEDIYGVLERKNTN